MNNHSSIINLDRFSNVKLSETFLLQDGSIRINFKGFKPHDVDTQSHISSIEFKTDQVIITVENPLYYGKYYHATVNSDFPTHVLEKVSEFLKRYKINAFPYYEFKQKDQEAAFLSFCFSLRSLRFDHNDPFKVYCYNKALYNIFDKIHDIFEDITEIETAHFMCIQYDDCTEEEMTLWEEHTSDLIDFYGKKLGEHIYTPLLSQMPFDFNKYRDDDESYDEPSEDDEEFDDYNSMFY